MSQYNPNPNLFNVTYGNKQYAYDPMREVASGSRHEGFVSGFGINLGKLFADATEKIGNLPNTYYNACDNSDELENESKHCYITANEDGFYLYYPDINPMMSNVEELPSRDDVFSDIVDIAHRALFTDPKTKDIIDDGRFDTASWVAHNSGGIWFTTYN